MTENINIQHIPITELLLDKENPRFGGNTGSVDTQKSLLESIVERYGVSDLLASMTANGYFSAEPVVAVKKNGHYTVVEGNRRLAAALILTGDERASGYKDLTRRWISDSNRRKIESLKQFPVSVYERRNEELIAYLGAKHIRGNKPWDSYAKAHWLFDLMSVSCSELTISGAAQLIGDQNPNTVKRILEAYVLMKQLREERHYKSESSTVSGRGSNPDYPFSWVYTSIGYENIRNWIDITGIDSQEMIRVDTRVLQSEKALSNSEKLVVFLFGSKTKPVRPVVAESREIRQLNEVVKDRVSVKDLEHGKDVKEVWENLRPVSDRLEDMLYKNLKDLETINTLVARETLQQEDLKQFIKTGKKSLNILNTIVDNLISKTGSQT